MSLNNTNTNEDIRNIKTEKALYAAMFSFLKKSSFKKITIKKICEEALISRATFYTHFVDKYDLLKHWIVELWPKNFNLDAPYDEIEKVVNNHIRENMPVLKNLMCDADNETLDILFNYILSTINLSVEKNNSKERNPKNIVLSSFYAGGIISYIMWQIRNKFPTDIPPMNGSLYDMICELQDWQSK